jgi:hypothetical protein
MTPHDRIFLDNQRAHDYASKYLAALDGEMFARCFMFTSAMQKFAEFLHLPEADSKLKRIFETALTLLAAVQPELFFVKFLGEEEKAVKVALAIGEATGSKGAKAIIIAGKVGEGAEKLKGGVEKYDAYKEKQEKRRQVPEAAAKLKQLDAGKKPVLQMLAAYSKAQGIWSDAIDALDKELENRLNADLKAPPPKESLEAMAQRLLKIPEPFTPDELEQLETGILWQIATAWARSSVTIVETRTVNNAYAANTVEYEGVNETQRDTLQDWFGFDAKRGKNFYQAPTLPQYPKLTLTRLGAQTKSVVISRPYAGR